MKSVLILPLLILLASGTAVAAQETHKVQFEAGNDNASVEGSVVGAGYADYVLTAKAGQTMSVSLTSGEGVPYFNILPPGSTGEAIYNSSIDGNDATGIKLPADGDYTIRIYLMGNEFETTKAIPYQMSVGIS